ncbi:DUF5801 repeats-in-toxin domain-containing protein [Zhongshania aliphaticivorans]|uniref:DUF5801 repeats-in-toxin domain-containing protein n=1 Tax=Zhongshania aliphaticivorans TaxID=1470434 RepID=UPI002E17DC57
MAAIDTSTAFSDADLSDTLTYSATGLPAGLTIDPSTGVISGTIDPSASQGGTAGSYSVVVTATDDAGATATQSFDWAVTNPAPIATADANDIDENAAQLVVNAANGVLSNDSDADGDTLTVSAVNGVAGDVSATVSGTNGGSFILNPDGGYVFNDNGDFESLAVGQTTTTQVTYTVSDGEGGTDTATLTITVTGTNDAPTAVADTGATDEDTVLNVVLADGVLSNDTDPDTNDTLVVSEVAGDAANLATAIAGNGSGTGNGEFTVNADGSYSFNPNGEFDYLAAGETETSTINYTVSDGQGGTDTASITVTITGSNDAPTAADDLSITSQNTAITFDVRGNDTDLDTTDVLRVTHINGDVISSGGHVVLAGQGTVTLNANGTLTFEPEAGFMGEVQIPYTVSDDNNLGNSTDTATWTVNVIGVDIIDDASLADANTGENVLSSLDDRTDVTINGQIPAGGALTNVIISSSGGGMGLALNVANITINGDGSFSSSADLSSLPDGTLTVTMWASDANNQSTSTIDTILQDTVTTVTADSLTVNDDDNTASLTGTGEPGASIAITVDGAVVPIATVVVDGNGDWSYDFGNDLSGNESVSVVATDTYGNTANDGRDVPKLAIADMNGGVDGHITVNEAGLDVVGSDAAANSESASGTFTITLNDALDEVQVAGTTISAAALNAATSGAPIVVNTPNGTMTISDYNTGTGVVSYSYELTGPVTHDNAAGNNSFDEALEIRVSDVEGDVRIGTLHVNIVDDIPTVGASEAGVVLAEGGITVGTGSGDENLLANDIQGADGARVHTVTYNNASGVETTTAAIADGGNTGALTTQYGSLTVHSDGSWLYTSAATSTTTTSVDHSTNGLSEQDNFSYNIIDADGDISATSATQEIEVTDTGPVIGAPGDSGVDEANLPTGSDPAPLDLIASGSLAVTKAADSIDTTFTAATKTALEGQLLKSGGVDVEYVLSDAHTLIAYSGAGRTEADKVFTVEINNPTASTVSYTFTLQGTLDHVAAAVDLDFGFTVTDSDGDSDTDAFTVTVTDDVPTAVNDTATVAEGSYAAVTGNVIDTGAGEDTEGADGSTITNINFGGTDVIPPANNSTTTINGAYGVLTIQADGTYSYQRDAGTAGGVNDVFTYTLEDADGDTDTSTLTVSITDAGVVISDVTPQASGGDVTVLESKLGDGTAVGSGSTTANGTFTITSPDGVQELSLTHDGSTYNIALNNVTQGPLPTITTALGNTLAITAYNENTGEVSYTYTLVDAETHTSGSGRNDLFENFTINLKDMDNDTSTDTLSVAIVDDIPVITQTGAALPLFTVDESTLGTDPAVTLSGLFSVEYGADGAALADATLYSLDANPVSGLVDTATDASVVFAVNGDGTIITGTAGGNTVLTISINSVTGEVTVDQQRAVKHLDAGDPNDNTSIINTAVSIIATATDGDGDEVTSTIAIGNRFTFFDDGPSITTATSGPAGLATITTTDSDLPGSSTANQNFAGAFSVDTSNYGADGNAGTVWGYALGLDDSVSDLKSNEEDITLSQSGDTITGTADGNTVFTITVNSATGVVTLTQFLPIDHTTDQTDLADFSGDTQSLLASLITLTGTATITDGDGDTAADSETINIGDKFIFEDDGPIIDAPDDATVNEANLLTGTVPNNGALTQTGSLDISLSGDGVDTQFAADSEADFLALGLTSNNVALSYSLSGDGHTLTAVAGAVTVFTATITNPTAAIAGYSYVLSAPIDHIGGNDLEIVLPFDVVVTDGDGDTATGSFDVTVTDDVPTAVAQTAVNVSEGTETVGSASGGVNLITGGTADAQGADGAEVHQIEYLDDLGVVAMATLNGVTTGVLNTKYGQLTVNPDGTWSYTSDAVIDHTGGVAESDQFRYNLIDGDGDISNWAAQPLNVTDTTPMAADDTSVTTTEGAALLSGNLIGNDTASADGTPTIYDFTYTDAAGDTQTFEFLPLVLTQAVTTPTGVLTVNSDGDWNFVPNDSYEHDATGSSDEGSFGYRLIDDDGSISNTSTQPIVITDTDPTLDNTVTIAIDEANNNSQGSAGAVIDNEVTELLNISKTQDDISDVVFNAATITQLESQNLSSGDTDLSYAISNSGHTLTASAGGDDVFVLQLNNATTDVSGATQSMTMTLNQPLDHANAGGTNNLAITVGYAVSDIDSTVSSSLTLNVTDDIPMVLVNDTPVTVVEGGTAVGSANTGANLLTNDTLGADGGLVHDISYTNRDGDAQANVGVPAAGLTVETQYGELTVNQDGSWTYEPIDSADHIIATNDTSLNDDFSYRVTDNDGDIVGTATQVITVTDTVPEFNDATITAAAVDEANLALGSDPDAPALTVTGDLPITVGKDTFDVTFDTEMPTTLAGLDLESAGVDVEYVLSDDDHTLTAYRGAGRAEADKVFTVVINDSTDADAGYTFILQNVIDEAVDYDFTFDVVVTDSDGDTDTASFDVTVADDTSAATIAKTIDEDSAGTTFNTSADATPENTKIFDSNDVELVATVTNGDGSKEYDVDYGTVTVNADGTITYVPNEHYSGENVFSFQTLTEAVTEVTITVNPIADAPTLEVDEASVETLEDTAVALGLNAPVVVDDTDANGVEAGDNPELLGAITLTGIPDGAILSAAQLDGTGAISYSANGGAIKVYISDGTHIDGAETGADITLTTEQFEALQVLPPEHDHTNFTVTTSVTSYEVNDSDEPLDLNAGAITSTDVLVYVQAVTDDAQLLFNDAVAGTVDNVNTVTYNGADTVAGVTIKEDTSFILNDILTSSFEDLDGSEVRSITIENTTGHTIMVNGTALANGDDRTINDKNGNAGQTGDINSFANITIGAAENFSGDLNGINITLNAQDKDSDGFNVGNEGNNVDGVAEANTANNSVTLNLHVTPVAGDVALEAGDITTPEDTSVAFLQNVAVIDTGMSTGTEVITKVIFDVPTDWVMNDSAVANGAAWTTDLTGNTYTIEFTAGTEAEREAVLDGFTITPAPHSSTDEDIDVTVTTQDSQTVNGVLVDSPEVDTLLTINVEVTAVAEQLVIDTDGDTVADITINADHDYVTPGEEDTWFDLSSVDDGVLPLDGWSNQDDENNAAPGSEQTFAVFTPTLISGDGSQANANGSQFRYSTDGGTTWVTQTFNGTAIEVPVSYLDTLQFKAANNFAGIFNIAVQAHTIDTDPDTGIISEWTGGSATLSSVTINPVADDVTLAVAGRARGTEDTDIALNIRPISSDSSETFNITLSDIPAGAILTYGGVVLDSSSGSVTITEFNRSTSLTIRPPEHSYEDFTLDVSAVSVDEFGGVSSISPAQGQAIQVVVRGDADIASLTTDNPVFTEASADAAVLYDDYGSVALSQVITNAALTDTDGSEVLTLSISGLDAQFFVDGATFIGGTGSGRTWLLTTDQLDDAKVLLPLNYSGTVTASVVAITTENDGDAQSSAAVPLSFTVTPSPEATINNTTDDLDEDTLGKVNFSLIQQNNDTDEFVSSIWIKVDDLDADAGQYTLYLGADGTTTLAAAVGQPGVVLEDGWYKLTDAAMDNVYAKGTSNINGSFDFGVSYEITDPSSDGTLVAVGQHTLATHSLVIGAVTDSATLVINSIVAIENGDKATIVGDDVEVSGNTKLEVNLTLTKDQDPNANNERDYDGSEQVTQVIIDGVPAGVTIENADYIGNFPNTHNPDAPNSGRWLLKVVDPVDDNLLGSVNFDLVYDFSGTADKLADLTDLELFVRVVTEDGNNNSEHEASDSWTLTTTPVFDDTNAQLDLAAGITTWEDDASFTATEDTSFTLNQALNGTITGSSDFSVTITGFPAGTQVSGMELTIVDGIETWTASGSGDDAALQVLLNNIQITLPDEWNNNTHAGVMEFQSTLTTYAPSGDRNSDTVLVNQPVTPVTDPAVLTISNNGGSVEDRPNVVGEDDSVTFTVAITNSEDGTFSQVVNDNLYVQLTETGMSGGTLSYSGAELTLQAVTGVDGVPDGDYYIVNPVAVGDSPQLIYQPSEHKAGTVKLSTWLQTQEVGAAESKSSTTELAETHSDTVEVFPLNDGFDITAEDVSGDEDTLIKLDISGTGLVDTDGSESVVAVLLSGLPDGFLVYTSSNSDGTGAVLANNAGSSGWSIPTIAGELPPYIAVLPPINWSGSVAGVTLTALSGEESLQYVETSQDTFDIAVEAVADGLTINPTNSFGLEGEINDINLNVSVSDDDGSEAITLILAGLGEYASFYDNGSLITGVSYDAADGGTYTLSNLTEAQLDTLGFIQTDGVRTVQVTVTTEDGGHISAAETGSFVSNISAVQATGGNDLFLYDGNAINGLAGEDTIQLRFGEDLDFDGDADNKLTNIETINLGDTDYDHSISNLSLADIQAMTDEDNVLIIDGGAGDTVELLKDNDPLTSGWVLDDTTDPDYDIYTLTDLTDPAKVTTVKIGNGINTSVTEYEPTTGDDTFVYDGSGVNGLAGEDTIQLRFGENLSGGDLADDLSNIEILDLSVTGANEITSLSLQDVLDMTDAGNVLRILGDGDDQVELSGIDLDPATSNWTFDAGQSDASYNVYTSFDGSDTATIEIQTGVIIE